MYMKKKPFIVLCLAIFAAKSVWASPALKTVGELGECLLNTANGNAQVRYEKPGTVKSPEEWQEILTTAAEDLTNSVTLNIADFKSEYYDIHTIANYNVSITAKGTVRLLTPSTVTYTFTYSPNYRIMRAFEDSTLLSVLTGDELAALTRAYEIKNEIIESSMTDYEKELAIHDYIVKNYEFDMDAAQDAKGSNVRAHSVTGMLLDGKGVCEAYANTFMLLCRMSGLDCDLATGTLDGVKHQWNTVKLGGEYYNIDLTSDDPVPNVKGRVYYNCFNLSDEEISKTHVPDNTNRKCSGIRYNYYNYNNLAVLNREDLLILLNDKLSRGLRTITFKTMGGYILENADDIAAAAEGRDLKNVYVTGEYGKEGIFTVTFN